jgi:hypothetical protein
VIGSDEDDISESACHQSRAAEQKCANEDLAQLRIRLYEREEIIALDLDQLTGLADAKSYQRRATRQHGDFAGELAWFNGCYGRRLSVLILLHGLDGSRAYDEKLRGNFADSAEHLTLFGAAHMAVRSDALYLSRRQLWKSLLGVRSKSPGCCRDWCRHDVSLS